MNVFTLIWLALGIVALLVEGVALGNRTRGDTLSENVWSLIKRGRGYRAALLMFLSWLIVHFLSGGYV